MSLVLNGGVGGSGTSQGLYINSKIASDLPVALGVCFKAANSNNGAGPLGRWVQSTVATPNTYHMGHGTARAVGPIITMQHGARGATSSYTSSLTDPEYTYSITAIAVGATTVLTVPGHNFTVGRMIRLTGTFTGVTGVIDGRDYTVQSISGSDVEILATTSGAWAQGSTADARLSSWQPNEWNVSVVTFGASGTSNSHRIQTGILGAAAMTATGEASGVTGQRGFDLWPSMDRFCIGCMYQNDALVSTFRGELVHAALFAPKLTTIAESNELLDTRPDDVTWGPPIAYWPFTSDWNDVIGTNHLLPIGSPLIVTSDDPYPSGEPSSAAALAAYYEMLRRVR